MRLTTLYYWSPENAEEVYNRFERLQAGDAPDAVKQALSKLTFIAWEKLATNAVVQVVEGEELDITLWIGYWHDLGEYELVVPSFDLRDEAKLEQHTPPPFMRR